MARKKKRLSFKQIEDKVIEREEHAIHRSRLTVFEKSIREAEIKALRHPYSTYRHTQRSRYQNSVGEWVWQEIEVIKHNTGWIIEFIQKELGSKGLIIGYHQVRDIVGTISNVFHAADVLFDAPPTIQLPLPMFNITPKITKVA